MYHHQHVLHVLAKHICLYYVECRSRQYSSSELLCRCKCWTDLRWVCWTCFIKLGFSSKFLHGWATLSQIGWEQQSLHHGITWIAVICLQLRLFDFSVAWLVSSCIPWNSSRIYFFYLWNSAQCHAIAASKYWALVTAYMLILSLAIIFLAVQLAKMNVSLFGFMAGRLVQ